MGYPNTDPDFEATERAEAAAEADRVADLDARNDAHSNAWLIEWPADRQMPVRYWHPTEGHVIDPNHAVRFARKEDAAAMCKRDGLSAGARPVEHMWGSASDPLEAAREAFLNLIAEAKRWDEDVDGEYHTDSPVPTVTVRYFGEFRESEVRDLTEALGISVHYDDTAGAAIERRLKADEAALAREASQ